MKCHLMNKTRPVLELDADFKMGNYKGMSLPECDLSSVKIIDRDFCPICIAFPKAGIASTEEAFLQWFHKRLVSDKRPDIPKRTEIAADWIPISGKLGQEHPNLFSLSDQYWIRFEKKENWDKMNFFKNRFSTVPGAYFFSDNKKNIDSVKYFFNSPDFTTNGVQPKRWIQRIEEGEPVNYLYKASYSEKDLAVMSEVLAAHYLRKWDCIPFVDYELGITNYKLCSKSRCFITESQEFVPASYLYYAIHKEEKADNFEHFLKCASNFGVDIAGATQFIDMMIEVDRRLLNFDRHFGNFGLIRNVDTGQFEGMAPLFDFGSAYFLSDETAKLLLENKVTHLFSNREKKLIREGKIRPDTDFTLPEELSKLPIDKGRIDNIYKHKQMSNAFISDIISEKENKKKKNKNKEHDELDYGFV